MKAPGLALLTVLLALPAMAQTATSQLSAAAQSEATGKPIPAEALNGAIRSGRAIANTRGLTLVLVSGKRLDFQDRRDGCPSGARKLDYVNCRRFILAADLPSQNFFLVRRQDYEGGAYFLVDDHTGRRTEIGAVPRFSPDGTRFLVQDDNVATSHENNLEIWRREGDGAVIEWAHPYKQVYVEAPVLKNIYHTEMTSWRGNRIALAFSSTPWFDTTKGRAVPALHWTGSLTRRASGWHLEASWPKAN